MSSSRLLASAGIVAIVIIIGFALSIPHARDGTIPPSSSRAPATTTPIVTLLDAYRRGVHTISGSVIAPDPCTLVTATATPMLSGTTTIGIALALTMPADQGICLELPSPITFSTHIAAPRGLPISVSVNGATASTSTSSNPS